MCPIVLMIALARKLRENYNEMKRATQELPKSEGGVKGCSASEIGGGKEEPW